MDGAEVPGERSDEAPETVPWTALDCLSMIAAHHGVDLPVGRLKHAYAVDAIPVSTIRLLRMAKDAGLRARGTLLDWGALFRLGEAYPVLVRLSNRNWIVVLGAGQGADGAEVVRVFDPLAERREEPLIVDKDVFCTRWTGDVILIKRERLASTGRPATGARAFSRPTASIQRVTELMSCLNILR